MKNNFFTFTIVFTIIEIVVGMYLNTKFYAGVYGATLIITILTFQPVIGFRIKKDDNVTRKKTIFAISFLFIGPIFIFATLPTYTYEEGKLHLMEEVGITDGDIDNFDEEQYKKTVPVVDNESYFLFNRMYHYEVNVLGVTKYYLVHPNSGEVIEMKYPYWRKY